ncbi:hypothetical protein PpBr36_04823 [Pyricularia pennisetigena]|uniref:hypothetical protein n=1 Tax=Pyricularia pennisetigena TaxID=1578925 RepID=UPI0011516BB1|nr:hypothetical protein PpBr36_04823 [Pyricularia pennisetigena]TLS26766.1 hypothetical protein PpBr36_04823 [Pyricularia pennisetigena]
MIHRYQSPSESTPGSNAYHEGLEVAAPQHNNLEVQSAYDAPISVTHSQHASANNYPNAADSAAERTSAWESKTPYPTTPRMIHEAVPVHNEGNVGERRGKKIGFMVGAIAAVIIAGVVSGIVGWQVTENRTRDRIAALEARLGEGANGGSVSQNDTTGAGGFMQRGSSISVTSWRPSEVERDFEMRVYYQKPNGGNIFYSLYSTSYGAWSKPIEVGVRPNRERRSDPPMEGTPLAAAVAWSESSARPVPWEQVLFVTNEGKIAMQDWGPAYPLWGTRATTYTGLENKVGKGGKMKYLWPHSVWEESSGSNGAKLTHLIQDYKEKKNFTAMTVEPPGGVSPGTPIVALPMKTVFRAPELRLVYRTRDGNLGIFDRSAENQTREAVLSRISVPDKAPIAGFSSRPDNRPLVTTKLLYRDADGKVQILTQRDGTGDLSDTDSWEGPETDPVFDGMDGDSQLECLTNSIARYDGVERNVAENDLMSRCFFQEGGKLKQVHWDGRAWKAVGFVPMPAE